MDDEASFRAEGNRDALREVVEGVRRAMRYSERPDRFLYGSDWPLAPMGAYRRFIESIVPAAHRVAVFGGNARALFGLP